MLNYSLELSKAQITFRIEDIQQFEKSGFQNIFDDPSFFKLTMFERKKTIEENRENMLNYTAKDRGDLKFHCSAINTSSNSQNQQENRL